MDYRYLSVQEGQQAALEYLRMIDPTTLDEKKQGIRKALLEYCGQDTLAMAKIREVLLAKAEERTSEDQRLRNLDEYKG